MATVLASVHLTDEGDADAVEHFRVTASGRLFHAIRIGRASILCTRPNLVKLAAAIAASMEAEDAACE